MKWVLLYVLIGGAVLYKIKYSIADRVKHNQELLKNIALTEKEIRVAKAKWAQLNSPQKLESKVKANTNMQIINSKQYVAKEVYVH